ncbi:MAG: SNF2-related protein [Desulfurococcales archaeon]|nr:SNF2-related protein [Desulfurococcales archaeon]
MALDQWRAMIAGELTRTLVYNPFTNLYLHLSPNGSDGFIRADGYVNLPHQIALYTRYLSTYPLRVFIADEIGLGKTVEALRFVKYAWTMLGARRILIVVPPNLVDQWVNGDAKNLGINVAVLDRNSLKELEGADPALVYGVYVGSMDTLKLSRGRSRYFDIVSSILWDVVIVDEAHKLGITPSGRETLRFKHIGELCRNAKHCILLSATPTRGYARDLLARLSLVDPAIDYSSRASNLIDRLDSKSIEALKALRAAYMVRRGKEHLKHFDDHLSKIPEARFHLFMVKPSIDELRLYNLVYQWTIRVLRELGAGPEVGLLRAILVKRALSSPLSLVKTLRKIVEGRAEHGIDSIEDAIRVLEDYMDGDAEAPGIEANEADSYEELLLSSSLHALSRESRSRLTEMITLADSIADRGDSTLHMLADMITHIGSSRDPLIPGDDDTVNPNVLVFTEYKDTLYYMKDKLGRFLKERGLKELEPPRTINAIKSLSNVRDDEARKIAGYARYYQAHRTRILLLYLSSDNTWMIPAVKKLVDNTSNNRGVRTVVLTTDVAGEGLNLQGANILVNYEVPWSIIKREQRIGRVWRIGQRKRVHIIDVIRATELEAEIYKRLLSKIYFLNLTTGDARSPGIEGLEIYELAPDEGFIPLAVRPREASEYNVLRELADTLEKSEEKGLKLGLDELASRISEHIARYRYIAEALTGDRPEDEARRMLEAVYNTYGASTHDGAVDAVNELASLLGRSRSGRLDTLLVSLEHLMRYNANEGGPLFFASMIDDSGAVASLLYIAEYRIRVAGGDRTIYTMPVLVKLKHNREGQGYDVDQVLQGLAAVKETARILRYSSPFSGYMIAELGNAEDDEIVVAANNAAGQAARRAMMEIRREYEALRRSRNMLAQLGVLETGLYNEYKPAFPFMHGNPRLIAVFYNISGGEPVEPGEEKKCMVQDAAESYVKRLFEERGFHVEGPLDPCPSSGRAPYDLIARPRSKLFGEEYYIEVKGHEGLVLSGELTERETRFARGHPDRYIICIVAMALSDNKKVFCNPYNKWSKRVKRSEREIVYVAGEG